MSQDTRYPEAAAPSTRGESPPDLAADEAAGVVQEGRHAGEQVAHRAGEQAREVTAEAGRQTRGLVNEGLDQIRTQARDGQRRAARGLHGLGDQLADMSRRGGRSGVAGDIVQQASSRAHDVASWLERREPADLLQEVQDFTRRRPGAFLLGAAFAGLAVGRLTRGLAAGQREAGPPPAPPAPPPPAAATAPPPTAAAPPPPPAAAEPPPAATPPPQYPGPPWQSPAAPQVQSPAAPQVPPGAGPQVPPGPQVTPGAGPEVAYGQPAPATWDPSVDPPLADEPDLEGDDYRQSDGPVPR